MITFTELNNQNDYLIKLKRKYVSFFLENRIICTKFAISNQIEVEITKKKIFK